MDRGSDMTKQNIAVDMKSEKIEDAPAELKSLIALNTALEAARASETDGKFISAALKIKILTDIR